MRDLRREAQQLAAHCYERLLRYGEKCCEKRGTTCGMLYADRGDESRCVLPIREHDQNGICRLSDLGWFGEVVPGWRRSQIRIPGNNEVAEIWTKLTSLPVLYMCAGLSVLLT